MSASRKVQRNQLTQTNIGLKFGLTAVQVGKVLEKAGLKAKNLPTDEAMQNGFAAEIINNRGGSFYVWDAEKVGEILKENGYKEKSTEQLKSAMAIDEAKMLIRRLTSAVEKDNSGETAKHVISVLRKNGY